MNTLSKALPQRPPSPVAPRGPDLVSTIISASLRKTLESRVEALRELLPNAGPARPVLAAELARLTPLYDRVHRQSSNGAVLEVPRGMKPEQLIAPPSEFGPALAAVRDRQLERVRTALANRDNWGGGNLPPVIADALKQLKPGRVSIEAMLNRSDVRAAINTRLVDFAHDQVHRWDELRQTLSVANHLFSLSL